MYAVNDLTLNADCISRLIELSLKASGVLVEQKPGSLNPPAFCSRWSQKELLQMFKMKMYGNSEQKGKEIRKTC